MYTRTLFSLSVALAFGLSGGVSFANPSHGGAHANPKSHAPAKKTGNTNPPAHKTGTNPSTNPSTTTQHPGHKDAATHQKKDEHPGHKDAVAHQQKEEHRQKEMHGNELRREVHELARLEADLDRLIREEQYRGHSLKNKNGQTNKSSQQQNGQQPFQSQFGQQPNQQQNGQQGSGQQQNASTCDQDAAQPQLAQTQESPGSGRSRHTSAGDTLQQAERLLMAAIHQLEQALSGDEGHRHHHLAEANRLLGEATRVSEVAAQVTRSYEHPRMEAAPNSHRS